MVVALDFGSAFIKSLIYDGNKFQSYKFSLSYFPQSYSPKNILESLKMLEGLSGQKILSSNNTALCPIYLSTAITISTQPEKYSLIAGMETSANLNSLWDRGVLDYGYGFIRFHEKISVVNFDTPNLVRWLPFKTGFSEVKNYIDNRKIYSNVLPIFPRDLYIEQALARETIISFMNSQEASFESLEIVLSGSIFSINPFPAQSLTIIIDSLNFKKSLDVYLDRAGLISSLCLFKKFEPKIFETIPDSFFPTFMASVLRFNRGVSLYIDLEFDKSLEVTVEKGQLFWFPLKDGEKAHLLVQRQGESDENFELRGGSLGFVVDCREFPITFPRDQQERMDRLKDWEKSVGASGRIYSL